MSEQIVNVVKAYSVGVPDSIVVVMPKELKIKAGTKFCVKKDERGRIIYEQIKKVKKKQCEGGEIRG